MKSFVFVTSSFLILFLASCTKEIRQNNRIIKETTWVLTSIGGQVLSEANKREWTFLESEDNEGVVTVTPVLEEVELDPVEFEYLIADKTFWMTDPEGVQTKFDIVHIKRREINMVNSSNQLYVLVPKFK